MDAFADKRCKQLRGLSDGEAVYTEDNEGAVIKYSCKPGFYLRGARLIKCRNGEWSASPPTCRGKIHNVTSFSIIITTTVT